MAKTPVARHVRGSAPKPAKAPGHLRVFVGHWGTPGWARMATRAYATARPRAGEARGSAAGAAGTDDSPGAWPPRSCHQKQQEA